MTKKRKVKKNKASMHKNGTTAHVGSIFVDHDAKQAVVVKEDILINQLRRDGPKIEVSFDNLCEKELIELSTFLSETMLIPGTAYLFHPASYFVKV